MEKNNVVLSCDWIRVSIYSVYLRIRAIWTSEASFTREEAHFHIRRYKA